MSAISSSHLFSAKLSIFFRVPGEERQWGAGGDISASVRIATARLGGTNKTAFRS